MSGNFHTKKLRNCPVNRTVPLIYFSYIGKISIINIENNSLLLPDLFPVTSPVFVVLINLPFPAFINTCIISEYRNRFSDHLVIQHSSSAVTIIIYRSVFTDAKSSCRLYRIYVCSQKKELPAISGFLTLDHSFHLFGTVITTGIFFPVCYDNK